jgi:hypothetical protein
MRRKTIFLVSGATFTFHGVDDVEENESVLQFSYYAQSDGELKVVVFNKAHVAGHSTYYMDE